MQIISQEQVNKRFQMLPESLQDVLFSVQTADAIRKACILREAEERTSIIAELTGRVLLGYLRPELFAQEIQKETGIEELKAQHIAHDIDMEIFSEVRLELKKLYPPTILTPNVQNQGFSREYVAEAPAPVAKPKYVIPIPERFQNKSFPGMTSTASKEEAPTAPPAPAVPVVSPEPLKTEHAPIQQTPEPTPDSQLETKTLETKNVLVEKKFENVVAEKPAQSIAPDLQKQPQQHTTSTAPKLGEKPTQSTTKIAQTVEPTGIKMSPVVPLPTFIGSRFQQQLSEDISVDSDEKIKEMASKFTTSSTAQPKPPQERAYNEPVDTVKTPTSVDLSKF